MKSNIIFSERCYVCGAFLEKGSSFCGLCGNSLNRGTACPECSNEIADVYSYCNFCGCQISEKKYDKPRNYPLERREKIREKEDTVNEKRSFEPEQVETFKSATPSELREERRLVTVLFADVSGFTSMSENLDAEDVKDTINSLFQILSNIIIREGGTIDKYIGDCIMALFGAPVSHGDDAARAVKAALKMQKALDRFAQENEKRLGVVLKMRIGINSGFALAGYIGGKDNQEYTVMGDTVNLASRMESTGVPGNIQISEYTKSLIGDGFVLKQVGDIKVKGKVDPVKAYFVVDEKKAHQESVGMAFMGREITFIGRERETNQLQVILSEVFEEGVPKLVVVEGKRGIGKSSLVNRFISDLSSTFVFHGRALKSNASEPFAPIIKAFRSFFKSIKESEEGEIFSYIFNENIIDKEIEKLPQEIFRNLISGDSLSVDYENDKNAISLRNYMKTLFLSVLSRISRKRPVVLLVSDAHLMDSATKEFLEFAVTQKSDSNRMLLIAEVQSNPDRPAPLFSFSQQIEHIKIKEFSEQEQILLIKEILNSEKQIPDWFTNWIFTNFSGNPLFITEFIKSLISLGVIVKHPEENEWIVPDAKPDKIDLPPTIHNAMQASMDILSNEEKSVFQAAAAIGFNFWDSVVHYVLDREMTMDSVSMTLDSLRTKGLIKRRFNSLLSDNLEFRFVNETLYRVACDIIPRKKKKTMNKRSAECLVKAGLDKTRPIMIAQYFEASGEYGKAVHYFVSGAQNLYEKHSLVETEQILSNTEKLFDIMEPGEISCDVHAKTGILRAQLLRSSGNYEKAFEKLEEVEKILPTQADENENSDRDSVSLKFRVLKIKGLIEEQRGEFLNALDNYEKGLSLIENEEGVDASLIYDIRASRNGVLIKLKQVDEAEKDTLELTGGIKAETIDNPQLANAVARHYDNLINIFLRKNDPGSAEPFAKISLELRKKGGNPRLIGISENNIAAVQTMQNRWQEAAEAFLNGLKQRERYSDPFDISVSCLNLSESYFNLGDVENARLYFEKAGSVIKEFNIGLTEELSTLENMIRGNGDES